MKVYIVFQGGYSDRIAVKAFTDKEKAEEYSKWLYDSSGVEEFETDEGDNCHFDKYYRIEAKYKTGPFVAENLVIYDEKCSDISSDSGFTFFSDYKSFDTDSFSLTIVRYVRAENWNKELYYGRIIKTVYDITAIIKQKQAEGFSNKEINDLFENSEPVRWEE